MPTDFQRKLRLIQSDIKSRVTGYVITIVWKDKMNCKHVDKYASSSSRRQFLWWVWQRCKAGHCTRFITDIWVMQTRVTAWQTVALLANTFRNGQKNCFPPSQPFNSEQFYFPHILWCQNFHIQISDLPWSGQGLTKTWVPRTGS